MFGTFFGQAEWKSNDSCLSCCIIGLTNLPIQARTTYSVYNPTISLFDHVWPCCLTTLIGAIQMHIHNILKIFPCHFGEHIIFNDACIIDEDIDPTPSVDCLLNYALTIQYVIVISLSHSSLVIYHPHNLIELSSTSFTKW